jgi:hypothetical protein
MIAHQLPRLLTLSHAGVRASPCKTDLASGRLLAPATIPRCALPLLAIAALAACSSDDDGGAGSSGSAGATGATGGSAGGTCTVFPTTVEGCNPVSGCGDDPVGWTPSASPGQACTVGTDCAVFCQCESPEKSWWSGVCACDACADYAASCAKTAPLAACDTVAPSK